MWVQLLIPRIEDGNNFGVSIQEETVAELRTVEGEAASYLDQISRFAEVLLKLVLNEISSQLVCFTRLCLLKCKRLFVCLLYFQILHHKGKAGF